MEQKQYWGTGIIRFFFDFWGTEEQSNLYKGNKGICTTLEGPLIPFKFRRNFRAKLNWRYAKIIQVADSGGRGGALSGQLCTDA